MGKVYSRDEIRAKIDSNSFRNADGCLIWTRSFHSKDFTPILKLPTGKQIRVRRFLAEDLFGQAPMKVFRCPKNAKCVDPMHCSEGPLISSVTEKLSDYIKVPNDRGLDDCHVRPNARKNIRAKVWVNGKHEYAYRALWTERFGPIPKGMQLDHRCLNAACFNLNHLQLVTGKRNMELAQQDGLLSGPKLRGEKHAGNKWNNAQKLEMKLLKPEEIPITGLMKKYGVSRTYASKLRNGVAKQDIRLVRESKVKLSMEIEIEGDVSEFGNMPMIESFEFRAQKVRIVSENADIDLYIENLMGKNWPHLRTAGSDWIKNNLGQSKILSRIGHLNGSVG